MGQVVYPTWAALSPSGEGSRHGRAGRGEGPRQAGQIFRCVFVRYVGIRAPIPHELNEEREKAHAVGEGRPTTPEAVSQELRRIHADLAKTVSQSVDKQPVREGRHTPGTRRHRECRSRGVSMRQTLKASSTASTGSRRWPRSAQPCARAREIGWPWNGGT
jgi:hypothetical protein